MSAVDLFAEIIKEHAPENIWQESPLIGYRRLGNTNRGEIGEEFVRRYLTASGIKVANGSRASKTDMQMALLHGSDNSRKPPLPVIQAMRFV